MGKQGQLAEAYLFRSRQELGKAFKQQREARGWSTKEVAYRLGVTVTMVQFWESGRGKWKLSDYAELLGFTLEEPQVFLLTPKEVSQNKSKQEDERLATASAR